MNRPTLRLLIVSVIALLSVETAERAAAAESGSDKVEVSRRFSGVRLRGRRFRPRHLKRLGTETAEDAKLPSIRDKEPKVYYVVVEFVEDNGHVGGFDRVLRLPVRDNETVLDAINHARDHEGGLYQTRFKRIWISRPQAGTANADVRLAVDWSEITQGRATNYKIHPGDRVFIEEALVKPLVSRWTKPR